MRKRKEAEKSRFPFSVPLGLVVSGEFCKLDQQTGSRKQAHSHWLAFALFVAAAAASNLATCNSTESSTSPAEFESE